MSMSGYTKLFNSILASTIWRAGKETKLLWITMLAMAGKDGVAFASVPGLAHMSGLSMDETIAGLAELSAPDPYSRTKDHEGRRVEEIDGGWKILNHAKYRAKMGADERREYKKLKQREYRDRDRGQDVDKRSTRGPGGHNTKAKAETKAYSKAENRDISPGNVSEAEGIAIDRLDADLAFEESRFRSLALDLGGEYGQNIQSVLDSLPRPATRSAFSASHWLRTGLTGVSRSEASLTMLRLTCDALEGYQRGKSTPTMSDKTRKTLDAIDRVLGTGEPLAIGNAVFGAKAVVMRIE